MEKRDDGERVEKTSDSWRMRDRARQKRNGQLQRERDDP